VENAIVPIGNSKVKDLTKSRFARLTVLGYAGKKKGRHYWVCECDCGNNKIIDGESIRRGHTKSCGCLHAEATSKRSTKHGHSSIRSSEYTSWMEMKGRCLNPNNNRFKNYGGKGISICNCWISSFSRFLEDMGSKPSSRHTIDRIDNEGNYEPGNCRWATPKEQARNRSTNLKIEYKGQVKCLSEWADLLGFNRHVLCNRLSRGWSTKRMLETPTQKKPAVDKRNRRQRKPKPMQSTASGTAHQ